MEKKVLGVVTPELLKKFKKNQLSIDALEDVAQAVMAGLTKQREDVLTAHKALWDEATSQTGLDPAGHYHIDKDTGQVLECPAITIMGMAEMGDMGEMLSELLAGRGRGRNKPPRRDN